MNVLRACCVVVAGAILSVSARALDVESPIIGHWPRTTTNGAEALVVYGDYVYIADAQRGVQIIDVSDRANPRWLAEIATGGWLMNVAYVSNYVYAADRQGGLRIIDVTNPALPQRVGALQITNCYDLDVAGGYAYLVRKQAGVAIVDVRNAINPQLVAELPTPGTAHDIVVSNTRAYIGTGAGLQTIDITNPQQPRSVSTNAGSIFNVGLDQNVLYTTSGIFDVSNPENPILLVTQVSAGYYFYLAGGFFGRVLGEAGIEFFDVNSPTNSFRAGFFSGEFPAMSADGEYAYLIDRYPGFAPRDSGLYVVPLRHRANPQRQGGIVRRNAISYDVAISGQHAYVPEGDSSLRVYSISNSAAPVLVRVLDVPCRDVAVANNRLYASESRTIQIFDTRSAANPPPLGKFTNTFFIEELAASSNFVYLAGSGGFAILDASDPARVVQVYGSAEGAYHLAMFGHYLCLPENNSGTFGAKLLDVSNPSQPQVLGRLTNTGWVASVALTSNLLCFIEEGNYYLKVVDISDPHVPRLVGSVAVPDWWLLNLSICNGFAYVSADHRGLLVFDLNDAPNPRYVGGNSSFQCRKVFALQNTIYAVGRGFFILDQFHPLKLGPVSRAPDSTLQVLLDAPPRQAVILQQSSNLMDWVDEQSLALTNPPAIINLTNSSASRRFYRAVWPD